MSRSLHGFLQLNKHRDVLKQVLSHICLSEAPGKIGRFCLLCVFSSLKFCHDVMSQLAPFVMIYMVGFRLKSETFAKQDCVTVVS